MTTPDPDTSSSVDSRGGLIKWFAGNHVAANLLMVLLLIGGFMSITKTAVEIFPEIDPRAITVAVPYPGATPSEVEESINRRVEEAISGIEGIDRVRSTATEGSGIVTAELEDDADDRQVLNDIESAVASIPNFPPQDALDPEVVDQEAQSRVVSIAIFGDVSERMLKETAETMRDDLTAMDGVSIVSVSGTRTYEIAIEVSEIALRRYELTFESVANAVRGFSVNLGGGLIRTDAGEILLRTDGQAYVGRDFESIVVRTQPDGTQIRVRDVATVNDGFEDVTLENVFNGSPAAYLNVSRIGSQDSLGIEAAVRDYVDGVALPAGINATIWSNQADVLRSRIDLLVRNGLIGLVLVFGCLVLFVDLRLAFWTTMGIPIAFLGAFIFVPLAGGTVNMISLFGLIVVLGVVVDDAIIVGENVYALREDGLPPTQAAIEGARQMAAPVTIGILTSVAAFLPLMFTSGVIGQILWQIPVVVISVLLMSLVEALWILPAHLSSKKSAGNDAVGTIPAIQRVLRTQLQRFIDGPYRALLSLAVRSRYATIAVAIAILLLAVGGVRGGHVRFVFFPQIDSDQVTATLTMANGTPAERTREVLARMLTAANDATGELDAQLSEEAPPLVLNISATLGGRPFSGGGGPGATADRSSGSNVAEVVIELTPSEERGLIDGQPVSARAIEDAWRARVGEVAGATTLSFNSSLFGAGESVNVELAHRNFDTLLLAVEALKTRLQSYEGVSDVTDTFEPGKRELQLSITDAGLAAGLTLRDLARQVRQAFYGEEAQRVQRGRDDIKVMVRFPETERRSLADLLRLRIRLPDGTEVPFGTVAVVAEDRGYASINRIDRRRTVNVTADIGDDAPTTAGTVNTELALDVLPELQGLYPGLAFSFAGEEKERNESMQSLTRNLGIAILFIFGLLGMQLRSYMQPLLIMSVIPFGAVGAIIGHVIMGVPLSFFSTFGIVALSGVLVNDSLILIDLINRERRRGVPMRTAIMQSGVRRFRPIVFTTLTTFLGLAPMLFEKSLQAQFLIPMAISLAFGIVFATALTLLLIPALYMVSEDLKDVWAGIVRAVSNGPSSAGTGAPRTEQGDQVGESNHGVGIEVGGAATARAPRRE